MTGHRVLIAAFLVGEFTQPFVLWYAAKFSLHLQGGIGLATDGSVRADYTVV